MKYRKGPVVIEAMKFEYSEKGINELKKFCGDSLGTIKKYRYIGAKGEAEIKTLLSAQHIVIEGDFVIKDVNGKIYPCASDIFEQTYEPVTIQ
jgi:hypothetical protein